MKALLQRLITGMEAGWKKCPETNHIVYFNCDPSDKLLSCCAVGHVALGLYDSARQFRKVEEEFKSIQVVNPTYERFPESRSTYVGNIKGDKTIDVATAISLLVARPQDGGYNWTTPQVIDWLKSHLTS